MNDNQDLVDLEQALKDATSHQNTNRESGLATELVLSRLPYFIEELKALRRPPLLPPNIPGFIDIQRMEERVAELEKKMADSAKVFDRSLAEWHRTEAARHAKNDHPMSQGQAVYHHAMVKEIERKKS